METVRLSNGLELSSFENEELNREVLQTKVFNSETESRARDEIVSVI